MITVKSITKTYHNGIEDVKAVNDVTLTIARGEYTAIVGPSGSGKSTLLHMMGGIEMPTRGSVLFEGDDVYAMGDVERAGWRRKHVGFVFQFYHLIEELNILENTALAAFDMSKQDAHKRAQELVEYLGIGARGKFYPSQLSGGEKQRAALARALMNDPQVLLCDEPTGSLDKDSQELVTGFFERLHKEQKKTIVIVTHNLDIAKQCGRVVRIKNGRLEQ